VLKILKELIIKFRTSPSHLTFLHPIFAKHCLLAKTYSYAKDIIENDIEDFDRQVNVLDFLLYHYYAGMLAIGLKDYNKALNYFRRVITTPAKVISAIMIESYKKYVLLSILLYGQKQPLPSYTDEIVSKKLNRYENCKKYKELENLFSHVNMNSNIQRINKLSSFQTKNNAGLAKQCTRAYTRNVIQKLTQTYVTMSFQEIAKEINLTDENSNEIVEHHLLSMIENNEIFAYINHNNGGMVSFYDNPERYDSNETMEKINECIQTVSQLNNKVLNYNRLIKKEYIIDASKKMKELKKNIDKIVINDDNYHFINESMQLDDMNGMGFNISDMDSMGFNISEDENEMNHMHY
jgi:COP9 signalosome complex subunit 3